MHGYRRESGTVYINGKIYENNKVVIKIRDKGCGIADIEKAMEPLFTTAPEEDRAGLGFAVMQSFCDKVKVKSTVGKGTAVTLEKVISSGRFLSRGLLTGMSESRGDIIGDKNSLAQKAYGTCPFLL